MVANHSNLHPKSKEENEVLDSVHVDVGTLGVVEEQNDAARVRCATRCGFESLGSTAKDEVEWRESSRKLSRAVVICLLFMAVEIAGGLYANSLAILTDAAHLLTDVAGFAISLFAILASRWEATPFQTFGYARLEILGALGSILLIWLLTGIVVYEATNRLLTKVAPVDGRLMFCIAALGLLVNLAMMYSLGHEGHAHGVHGHGHSHSHEHGHGDEHSHRNHENREGDHIDCGYSHGSDSGHHHRHEPNDHAAHDHGNSHQGHSHSRNGESLAEPLLKSRSAKSSHDPSKRNTVSNINVEGAYLHVLGDLLQSVGVMIGGAVIWYHPSWKFIDPICTLFFSVLVLGTTLSMIRDIVGVLMESTPKEIDAEAVERDLLALPGVAEIHDLHIWAITVGKTLLACHVRVQPHVNTNNALQAVADYCEKVLKIGHVTIQVEIDS